MKRYNPFPIPEEFKSIYSHAVEISAGARTLYVSGQVGADADGNTATGFRAQCIQAIKNIETVLIAAQMTLADIVKITFITRREDLPVLREVRLDHLAVAPAVTVVIISGLHDPDWLVEIDAVAAKA